MIITCCGDGVIPFIYALAGRTVVCQRPAGGGKQRVSAGLLQPSGHGDTSPLHVPGGELQRDHPAGCTQGYEGKIGVPRITKEVNIPHMNSFSIKLPRLSPTQHLLQRKTKVKHFNQGIQTNPLSNMSASVFILINI